MNYIDINDSKALEDLMSGIKNSAKVGFKDGVFYVSFKNAVAFNNKEINEFQVKKPTTTQVEAALNDLDLEKDGLKILKKLLSSTLTETLTPEEVGNYFAPEELKVFEKILVHFLG